MLTEASAPGDDFLAEVCVEWEKATALATEKGIRVVNARFGMILDANGGALKKMLPPFRMGDWRKNWQRETVDELDCARRRGRRAQVCPGERIAYGVR